MQDSSDLVQAVKLSGNRSSCDAILIADYESVERFEEVRIGALHSVQQSLGKN
jgi:hypothetical protein